MREGLKYHKRPLPEQLTTNAQTVNRLALKLMSEGSFDIEKLTQIQQKAADIIQIINGGITK